MCKRKDYNKKKLTMILTLMMTLSTTVSMKEGRVQAAVNPSDTAPRKWYTWEEMMANNGIINIHQAQVPESPVYPEPTATPGLITPIPSDPSEGIITPAPSNSDGIITPTPEPTTTPTPIVTPEPTTTPTQTPSATPTPTKSPYRSRTLEVMSNYDYVGESVTGISSKKVSVSTLQSRVKKYGKLYGTGMPYKEYVAAMSREWIDATEYDKEPVKISVDLTKTMDYNAYVSVLKRLSRYEGVYIYKIGKSTEGRDLYAIEIDIPSKYKKEVFMLSGNIHAREFAGGTFIVKQFVDLVQKAQTNEDTMELLKKYKYVAVPIVNVDGREALITEPKKWSLRDGSLWKAYTNGTDGGRNFPGLQWGQVGVGYSFRSITAKKPGYANYPGEYGGSNKETKALMKWLYHYTIVEQAKFYVDMHQQGSIIYAGKKWQTQKQEQRCLDLRSDILSVLNKGNTKRKYNRVSGSSYGLQGQGSTLADYALSLAVGSKFSPAYGFHAFVDNNREYILMEIKDIGYNRIKIKEANKKFAALTLEIGYGRSYLGNSASTRKLLANEYKNYNFDKMLESFPKMLK